MTKYITYIETSVGGNTYTLTIESDEEIQVYNNVYYYIKEAKIAKANRLGQSSNNPGPYQEKEFYDVLRFPIEHTMVSQKKIEY